MIPNSKLTLTVTGNNKISTWHLIWIRGWFSRCREQQELWSSHSIFHTPSPRNALFSLQQFGHSRFYDRSAARAVYRGFSGQTGSERWVATSAPAVMDLLAVKRLWVSGETAKSLTPLTFCCSGDLFWLGWWSLRCCQPGIIDTVCPEVRANGAGFIQGCSAQVERASRDYYPTLHDVTWRLNLYELTAASRVWWSPLTSAYGSHNQSIKKNKSIKKK